MIREEHAGDVAAIRDVHDRAFGRAGEGQLVDALRAGGATLLSLVAVAEDQIVGHIFYSPASIGEIRGAGLAPVGVLPEHQRRGLGHALIEAGNQRIRDTGCPFIIVLGHPDYYQRFGFTPASRHGVTCQWDVPDEAFMMLVLDESAMKGQSGVATYRQEFLALS